VHVRVESTRQGCVLLLLLTKQNVAPLSRYNSSPEDERDVTPLGADFDVSLARARSQTMLESMELHREKQESFHRQRSTSDSTFMTRLERAALPSSTATLENVEDAMEVGAFTIVCVCLCCSIHHTP
jgi:hypothetical protein